MQYVPEHFHGIDFFGHHQVRTVLLVRRIIARIIIHCSCIVGINVSRTRILDALAQRRLGAHANHFFPLLAEFAEQGRKVGIACRKHNPLHLRIESDFHRIDRHLDIRRIFTAHRMERVDQLESIFVQHGLQRNQFAGRPFAVRLPHDNLPQRQELVHQRLHAILFNPVGQVFCIDKNCNVIHESIYSKEERAIDPDNVQKAVGSIAFGARVTDSYPTPLCLLRHSYLTVLISYFFSVFASVK